MDIKDKRVIIFDLDGTLIETESGKTFPENVSDMKLRREVINKIKPLAERLQNSEHILCVGIISNQGGISLGYVDNMRFIDKMNYVKSSIRDIVGADLELHSYFCSSDKDEEYRKPNTGYFKILCEDLEYLGYHYEKEKMVMIGDASGKPGDFSESDKMFAKNCGVDYIDVEDFIKIEI